MLSKGSPPQKNAFRKLCSNLTLWVVLAMVLGILVGVFRIPIPNSILTRLKDGFIFGTTCFVYPLVFLTISLGIASMGSMWGMGRVGLKALLYFEVVTTLALVIGISVAIWLQPGAGVPLPIEGDSAANYSARTSEVGLSHFLLENHTLQVLLASVLFGVGLGYYPQKQRVIKQLETLLNWVFMALRWFMLVAPLAAFAGMALTVQGAGLQVLMPLIKLLATVYLTMALFIGILLNGLLAWRGISLWKLLRYLRAELLLVLGTSSSETALPTLMAKLETMGCSKSIVGIVVPTGYSFNLDGTTLYLSLAMVFLTQVYGVEMTLRDLGMILGVLMVTSKGAAGVVGAGFVVLASTLKAVPVVPVEGLVLLLGVDRLMSEARSITNFIGNAVATVFLASQEGELDLDKMEQAFRASSSSLQ